MILEVVRESSDVLVPLKSVAGGLSALFKQYDVSSCVVPTCTLLTFVCCDKQFISNKDDVRRLIVRVEFLSTSLTGPPKHSDIEETDRREVLER